MPTLLSLLVVAQLVATDSTPGLLPPDPSLVQRGFDYAIDDLEELEAHAQALQDELGSAIGPLRVAPTIHRLASPYLGVTPFDGTASLARTRLLSERLEALGTLVGGNRSPLQLYQKALDEAILQRWVCAHDCEPLARAVLAARARLVKEEQLLVGRIDGAALEAELVLLQLEYLRAFREGKRVRQRRPREQESDRPYGRRHLDPVLPPELVALRERRVADAVAAAERARQEQQRLTSIGAACKARAEWRAGEAARVQQIATDRERLAQIAEQLERERDLRPQYEARLSELFSAVDDGEDVAQRFDSLHAEFFLRIEASLQERDRAREALGGAEKALAEARKELQASQRDVPILSVAKGERDPCSEVGRAEPGAFERAQKQVAEARVAQEQRRVETFEVQVAISQAELDIAERRFDDARFTVRQTLPYLSSGYQSEVYSYNADFFRHMGRNIALLVRSTYEHLGTRATWFRDLRILSWNGIAWGVGALFWLVVIVLIGRMAMSRWHTWVISIWTWSKARRWLQRVLEQVHALLKLLSVAARPAILWVCAWFVAEYLGRHNPEVQAIYTVVEWVLLYRILRALSRALFVRPTWPADRHKQLASTLDTEPVFDREPEAATLSDRSLHLIIVYFIWRTAALTSVEMLLGQDYLFHLVGDMVAVVQWALICVLIVWWRERVAAGYLASGIELARSFVERYQSRLWFAVFALPMAMAVVVKRAVPWAQQVFGTAGFAWVSRFLSRRALEQAARKRKATMEAARAASADIPTEYRRHFTLRPLDGEPYALNRIGPVLEVVDAFASWTREKREGSVAIVGEAGMGKTTLIHQVLNALPIDAEAVRQGRLQRKLSTQREVIEFLAATFGFSDVPETIDDLVQAILDDPNPVVVIDDAHHFFLKAMGGLVGLDTFVHVVNLTSTNVFWVTAFDSYPWFFIKNLKRSEPPFGHIVYLQPWGPEDIEGLIMSRSNRTTYTTTFQDLVVERGVGDQAQYEVVKTARSYFRLLCDMTRGNPSVALRYWLSSLRREHSRSRILRVGLYNPDPPRALLTASDEVMFLLTCIAEHASLTPAQISAILRAPKDAVARQLAYCEENALVYREGGVVMLNLQNYRQIVSTLSMRSFVYFEGL